MVIIWAKHATKEYDNGRGPFGKPLFDPRCASKPNDDEYYHLVSVLLINILYSFHTFNNKNHHIRIISSPFARARGTAQRLKNILEEKFCSLNRKIVKLEENLNDDLKISLEKNIKITIEPVDVRIGEYLGNQRRVSHPLTPYEYNNEKFFYKDTVRSIADPEERKNFPYLSETVQHLEQRCKEHIEKEKIDDYFNNFFYETSSSSSSFKEHRIYISHGFVIQKIIKKYFESLRIDEIPKEIGIDAPLDPLRGFVLHNQTNIKRF